MLSTEYYIRSIMVFDSLIHWSNLLYLIHWLSRDSCLYKIRIPTVCCHIRKLQKTTNALFSTVSTSSSHCNNTHGECSVSRHALKLRSMTTDADISRNSERESALTELSCFWKTPTLCSYVYQLYCSSSTEEQKKIFHAAACKSRVDRATRDSDTTAA